MRTCNYCTGTDSGTARYTCICSQMSGNIDTDEDIPHYTAVGYACSYCKAVWVLVLVLVPGPESELEPTCSLASDTVALPESKQNPFERIDGTSRGQRRFCT